jgi:ketosteroid isomerase-like protein
MSGENVKIIRRVFEHYERTGERDESFLDPEVVWDLSRSRFPDAGVYHGIDGVRDWFQGLTDAFGDVRYEVEEIRGLDERVVVLLHLSASGPSSGIAVDYRFVPVFTFRDGKVIRMDRFDDWAAAIEAVGLSE